MTPPDARSASLRVPQGRRHADICRYPNDRLRSARDAGVPTPSDRDERVGRVGRSRDAAWWQTYPVTETIGAVYSPRLSGRAFSAASSRPHIAFAPWADRVFVYSD